MIIIATNNGLSYINRCVENILNQTVKTPVAIIDTNSSDINFKKYTKGLCTQYNFDYIEMNYSCYDFGAYYKAMELYPNEPFYWFQHDSIIMKNPDTLKYIQELLENNDIVSLIAFNSNFYETDYQRNNVKKWFGKIEFEKGVYGPNFGFKNDVLNIIKEKVKGIEIKNKEDLKSMERGWAVLFEMLNFKVANIETKPFNFFRFYENDYDYFIKAKHENGPRQ